MRVLLPLLLVLSIVAPAARAGDDGWVAYAERDDVVSYSKTMPGSRLLATRGVTTFDLPIATLVGVYLDTDRAADWVNLLVRNDAHPILGGYDAIERHIYDVPWPATDREFVFRRTVSIDAARKVIRVTYKSVDDPRHPVTDDYVRATDHGSYFEFMALPGGRTRVEAVAMVDPEGSLPTSLVNLLQRSWPRESLHGLLAEARKGGTPFAACVGW